MKEFWLCFVPLFVAVDAIGVLPMFMNLTHGLSAKRARYIVIQSIITALIVALLFLAIGQGILKLLGITITDFMMAGGLLLFIISISDMLNIEKKQRIIDIESLGAVPIGVPLIVGPAVLTTIFLLVGQYGYFSTVMAIILNILIAGSVFYFAKSIHRFLGKAGSKTISKLASLLLAAIAVMIIRKGIMILILSNESKTI